MPIPLQNPKPFFLVGKNAALYYQNHPFTFGRSFVNTLLFMDAYYKGLNGKQATWAVKKYCSH
ncbi:hypothetical protein PAXRUDRAFT_163648 [Paxillus rubicundulus Ve08.2h10]|uniref:Uncharacterized protein n=1 Tax=Paxillus rubicundulus Ve08.2h10 TaxID=930991 RepID=A0A0D0C609_9AGAM|nr:hypothetical protein PAXRUDRAFT_163648 [Paxillus rubicundulus Ve08.2h10]